MNVETLIRALAQFDNETEVAVGDLDTGRFFPAIPCPLKVKKLCWRNFDRQVYTEYFTEEEQLQEAIKHIEWQNEEKSPLPKLEILENCEITVVHM